MGCTGLKNDSFSIHLAETTGSVELDANRSFTFTNVLVGTYKIIVKQFGMQAASLSNVSVSTGVQTDAGDITITDCGGVPDLPVAP